MSKTSQRKKSLFDQGYEDGKAFKYERWKRHPYLKDYKNGYKKGLKEGGWRS